MANMKNLAFACLVILTVFVAHSPVKVIVKTNISLTDFTFKDKTIISRL
jgi:hypothetical protein